MYVRDDEVAMELCRRRFSWENGQYYLVVVLCNTLQIKRIRIVIVAAYVHNIIHTNTTKTPGFFFVRGSTTSIITIAFFFFYILYYIYNIILGFGADTAATAVQTQMAPVADHKISRTVPENHRGRRKHPEYLLTGGRLFVRE